ncbi:MAG: protein phosphatase 2C domain-containing protein [Clostridia bacterium]|nr:protein phosphatase 2C domain-containing protein [Clostridia bacterium]
MKSQYTYALCSEQGGRACNEDKAFFRQKGEGFLAMVADGLGGHGGGDVASAAAVEQAAAAYERGVALDASQIQSLFDQANAAIRAKQNAACKMKSTLVLCVTDGQRLLFAHAGDSRAYLFRNGTVAFQTLDHSVSQMAVALGEITPDQIRFHEDRNRVLRALGNEEPPKADIREMQAQDCDAILLCSDGFWEYVPEGVMCALLRRAATAQRWLDAMCLYLRAHAKEGNDNYSAVAAILQMEPV